jgi:Zn-dependent M28 family amino/carboxypeptidase
MTRIFLFTLLFYPCLIGAQSNTDTLRKHVVRLSTFPYARTQKNIETLNKAANYIHQYFSKSSEHVVFQNYELNHIIYKNIIASFGPPQGSRFILGAHYDVYGEAPGADKNASGVAGLLEIARLLKRNEKHLAYRIDLVAYTLGDANSIAPKNSGSFLHANSLKENRVKVLGMINLDCIGFFTDRPRSQVYPFFLYPFMYGRIGNFIAIIQQPGNGLWARQMRYLFKQYMHDLRVINFKPAVPFNGFADGDQKNYWDLGYPAILVTDTKFYRNKNYHYDLDTFETLDYFRMAKVVDMVYKSLIHYQA